MQKISRSRSIFYCNACHKRWTRLLHLEKGRAACADGSYPAPGVIQERQIVCIGAPAAETPHSGGLEIRGLNRERRK